MSYVYQVMRAEDIADLAQQWNRLENFGNWYGWYKLGGSLIELAGETGEPVQLDIVGLCCEFSHAGCWHDAADQLGLLSDSWDTTQAARKVQEYLNDNTWLAVAEDDCVIWQTF